MTCDCEFDEYEEGDEDYGEESWHYRRTCLHCGHRWWGLHCPHDGRQNPCPSCGIAPAVVVAEAVTGDWWAARDEAGYRELLESHHPDDIIPTPLGWTTKEEDT